MMFYMDTRLEASPSWTPRYVVSGQPSHAGSLLIKDPPLSLDTPTVVGALEGLAATNGRDRPWQERRQTSQNSMPERPRCIRYIGPLE